MTTPRDEKGDSTAAISGRITELFHEQQQSIVRHADILIARLMVCQWLFGVGLALLMSPLTWVADYSRIHIHVWAALLLGGAVTSVPVILSVRQPGQVLTRHAIAIGQMLMSALLIHLTGGRLETHFHIFGSLAILAFYRDWRVLISASAVVFADHLVRGIFWPQSVFGVLASSPWRAFEHAGWVVFEVTFLLISIRKSRHEMFLVAERQARLEFLNARVEQTVAERTADLTREIAERRQAEEQLHRSEEQLRQAQKMEAVGRLAGGVAHDFNNLLTVIGGYCALSLRQVEETNPLNKSIQEIQKASDRAADLTRQLLAFSRKQVLQPRVLQLNEVVHNMEKMLRRLIGEDIELATSFDPGVGNIKADPTQVEQVVMNLVINARDAMPRGGKLTIGLGNASVDTTSQFRNRTLEPGEYVCLSISDNGMGMTEDTKSHLFEPFFTTKGQGKGTGLGLATCYGIMTQSGGDIRVYSELNSGTTFKIFFPRTDAMPDSPTTIEPKSLPSGSESILVVEDEPSVRRLAVFILRERGYQVQEANNAFEALELIRKRPQFDLVLTDVIMPQMSGKELYDEIKAQRPQTKVLLMSGYTDDALAHHGVLDDGLHFLEKPFPPSRLARKVREVLDTPVTSKHSTATPVVPSLAAH